MVSGKTAIRIAASRAFLISSRDLGIYWHLVLIVLTLVLLKASGYANLRGILRFAWTSSGGRDGEIPEVGVQKLPSCFEIRISVNSEEGRYSYIVSSTLFTFRTLFQ